MPTNNASQMPRMSRDPARVLIYGFGPYRQFQTNVSEMIVRDFPRIPRLRRIVFQVKFNKVQFIKVITHYRPDVILGLGQCSRGSLLRIETATYNRKRNDKKERPRPIIPGGALKLSTNLRLDLGREGRPSHYPGDYVCNYSVYVILQWVRRRRAQSRLGFVHIPRKYDPKKATKLLARALRHIMEAKKTPI